jgi:hypothetical protein
MNWHSCRPNSGWLTYAIALLSGAVSAMRGLDNRCEVNTMLLLEVDENDGRGWGVLNCVSPSWPDSEDRLRDLQYRWQPYFGSSARFRIREGKPKWRAL